MNSTPDPTASGIEFQSERRVSTTDRRANAGDRLEGFGRRSTDNYLETMIATASPARLRLMLIERAVEVSRHLAIVWRDKPGRRGTNEHSLKLFELLSELLSGITDKSVEVCRTQADLYVFLCQHVMAAEDAADPTMIDEVRLVLETEAETWRMVCARETGATLRRTETSRVLLSEPAHVIGHVPTGGLNLQG